MEFRMGVDMTEYHLVGIGNALVDVLAPVEDTFLEAHALDKGAMTLVDNERSTAIHKDMPPAQEVSGGSCGNTMAGFASLGGKGAFIGKVRDDQLDPMPNAVVPQRLPGAPHGLRVAVGPKDGRPQAPALQEQR